MGRLIITNGDAAGAGLRGAGLGDLVLAWADALHDGPVPAGLALEELSKLRADYLSATFGLPHEEVRAKFEVRDRTLRGHRAFDRVEIWLEHDLYDQLQLFQLLDFFAGEGRADVLLVQSDDYLGRQSPDVLHALASTAAELTVAQFEAACAAWTAFTAPTPIGIAQIALSTGEDFPHLRPALLRLLAELPAPKGGLSLTEWRVLVALLEGPRTVATLYRTVAEQDRAQFLSDVAFFVRLDGLAFGTTPLIAGLPGRWRDCERAGDDSRQGYAAAQVALTDAGRAALLGRFDHAVANAIDRWIGGTHITPDNLWRWNPQTQRLLAP